jgi:hypothetical protein
MRRTQKAVLAASALGLLGGHSVRGGSIVLTFQGLKENEQVQNYYNGGLGQLGSGPGPSFGITFTGDDLVLTDARHYIGEPTPPEVMLLGNNSAPGGAGVSATMNVAGGFVSDLAFYYGSIDAPGLVQVFSGPNGTGTMLGSQSLAVTSTPPDAVFTAAPVDVSFTGVAQSAVFKGGNQQIVFDNIQLTTVGVPGPTSLLLLAEGTACLLVGLGRRLVVGPPGRPRG